MVKRLLLVLAATLLPALVSAACTTNSDCAPGSGAVCDGGTCTRTHGCTTNSECRTKTGAMNALCEPASGFGGRGACYVPSNRIAGGASEGSSCGNDPNRGGDDYSCSRGLVCRNFACAKPSTIEVPTMCTTTADCDVSSGATCVNGACQRTFGCTSNAECRSAAKTGNPTAVCDTQLNACFVPSTSSDGIPAGGACATTDMTTRQGDDISCDNGLVCRNNVCASFATVVQPTGCTDNSDCDTGSGAMCVSGQCSRTFVCSSDAECRAKTGVQRARCDKELNACFVASSTITGGIPKDGQCGTSDMPNRRGDDISCAYGLVCRNLRCTDMVVGAGCLTNGDCGPNQTCVKPKLFDFPEINPGPTKRNGIYLGGTCSSDPAPSPYYNNQGPVKYKRSLQVGQAGIADTRAVLRGRQAKTPRQYRARGAQPS